MRVVDWARWVLDTCLTGHLDVIAHRGDAASLWHTNGPDVEPDFPRYFEDRLAFRLALLQHATPGSDLPSDILDGVPLFGDQRRCCTLMKSHPLVGPAFPAHRPEQVYRPHGLTMALLERWHSLLVDVGLSVPESHFDPRQYHLWQDVFGDSIYRPGPPAIDGPSFLDRFRVRHQTRVLDKYGAGGIVAFTMALVIAHERTHRLQRGEPLLSEFVLASLWVRFVAEQDLDDLQNDPETQTSCTIEKPHLSTLLPFHANGVDSDTARIFSRVRRGRQTWYSLACALAYLHDGGFLSYQAYLESLASLLRQCAGGADLPDTATVLPMLRPPKMSPTPSIFNLGGTSVRRD